MPFDKNKLLQPKIIRETVKVEGWGSVKIREMSAESMFKMTKLYETASEENNFLLDAQVVGVIASVEDDSKQLAFDDGDREAIKQLPIKTLNSIMDHIQRINGMDEVEKPENQEKN